MGMLKRFFSRSKGSSSALLPASVAATHPGNTGRPGMQHTHSARNAACSGNGDCSRAPSDPTASQQSLASTSPTYIGSQTTAAPPAAHLPADETGPKSFQDVTVDDIPAWPHAQHRAAGFVAAAHPVVPSSSVAQWGGPAAAPHPANDVRVACGTPARPGLHPANSLPVQATPKRAMQEIPSTVSCRRPSSLLSLKVLEGP